MTGTHRTTHVLFVCLGNICRSPMAEAIFRRMVDQAGLSASVRADSAGTGAWHVGEPPHSGTLRTLRSRGLSTSHKARVVTREDFAAFDYIVAMDQDNMYALRAMAREGGPKPALLLDYAPGTAVREVPDPYYTDRFEEAYTLIEAGCRGLLEQIVAARG